MMVAEKEKLQFRSNSEALGVIQTVWKAALEKAEPDPVVKIRHAEINGDSDRRIHVAAIPDSVGCHFHAAGNEDYAVVFGEGTLYWGRVEKGDGDSAHKVIEEIPVNVKEGDSFIIPEGYAHQLKNTGTEELVIVFACPDTHLKDDADRTILPNLAS